MCDVYVCDWHVHVCMCVHACNTQKSEEEVRYSALMSLSYFFERGSLIETGVGLWSASPSDALAHSPSLRRAGVKGVRGRGWVSICLLRIWSQALKLAKTICPVSKLDFNYKDNSGLRRKRVYKKMSNKIWITIPLLRHIDLQTSICIPVSAHKCSCAYHMKGYVDILFSRCSFSFKINCNIFLVVFIY